MALLSPRAAHLQPHLLQASGRGLSQLTVPQLTVPQAQAGLSSPMDMNTEVTPSEGLGGKRCLDTSPGLTSQPPAIPLPLRDFTFLLTLLETMGNWWMDGSLSSHFIEKSEARGWGGGQPKARSMPSGSGWRLCH